MYSYMYNLCICWRIFYFLLDLLNMVLYRYFSNGPFIPNPAVMDVTAGIIQKYMDPVQVCVDIIGQLLRQITAKAATKVQCVTAHIPSKYSASPLSCHQSTVRHHSHMYSKVQYVTTLLPQRTMRHRSRATKVQCATAFIPQSTVRHHCHTLKYSAPPLSCHLLLTWLSVEMTVLHCSQLAAYPRLHHAVQHVIEERIACQENVTKVGVGNYTLLLRVQVIQNARFFPFDLKQTVFF